MKNRTFLLGLFALLAIVVAACSPPPPELRNDQLLSNPGLISGEPCFAPCWNNITPGETSYSEALTILEDDPTLTNVQREDLEDGSGSVVTWQEGEGIPCCQIFSEDGRTVTSIFLLTKPESTVGDVIEIYGEPEYVHGVPVSDDQAVMQLVFPEKNMIVQAFVAGAETGALSENSEVIGVTYLAPETMEQLVVSNDLYFWDGYDTFKAYIDGEFDITAVPTSDGSQPEATEESE
ncbi:MAG: hypothetical protein D6712_06905 [Chloroflexi bacterium]|nr:MAG: hypothetical protein D6712_06905 [Chloroflexota bacterium]